VVAFGVLRSKAEQDKAVAAEQAVESRQEVPM